MDLSWCIMCDKRIMDDSESLSKVSIYIHPHQMLCFITNMYFFSSRPLIPFIAQRIASSKTLVVSLHGRHLLGLLSTRNHSSARHHLLRITLGSHATTRDATTTTWLLTKLNAALHLLLLLSLQRWLDQLLLPLLLAVGFCP